MNSLDIYIYRWVLSFNSLWGKLHEDQEVFNPHFLTSDQWTLLRKFYKWIQKAASRTFWELINYSLNNLGLSWLLVLNLNQNKMQSSAKINHGIKFCYDICSLGNHTLVLLLLAMDFTPSSGPRDQDCPIFLFTNIDSNVESIATRSDILGIGINLYYA